MTASSTLFDELNEDVLGKIKEKLNDSDKGHLAVTCRSLFSPSASKQLDKHPYLLAASKKLKELLQHVINGEKDKVEEILKSDPGILLDKGKIVDRNKNTIDGTALGVALGREDVGIKNSPCHIIKINGDISNFLKTQTNLKIGSSLSKTTYIRCNDKLFYNVEANNTCIEVACDKVMINQLDHELKPGNLSRLLTEDELAKIAQITDHYHNEEMAEMILRYFKKLPNSEIEIAKQIQDHFPAGWEEEDKKRKEEDFNKLTEITKILQQKQSIDECSKAIQLFIDYLNNKNKGKFIKYGKHYNAQLLAEAYQLYDTNFSLFDNEAKSPKNSLFWCKIIGSIQQLLPASYAQALSQGFLNIVNGTEKLRRDLTFRSAKDMVFFSCGLGEDKAVGWNGQPTEFAEKSEMRLRFKELINQRHARIQQIITSHLPRENFSLNPKTGLR